MSEIVNQVVSLSLCAPHPQNYNQHSAEQVADLRASLRKFGQVRSVVVQDDAAGGFLLVAGHGLAEAARAEGFSELRADVIPSDWPPVKVLAYLAADNELGRAASPDEAQLALLVQSVGEVDAELAALAAGGEQALLELLSLVTEPTQVDLEDRDMVQEMDDQWGVQPGDIWVTPEGFGLACGDCRDAAVWDALLAEAGAQQVQMVVTSPPYAQQRASKYGGIDVDGYVDWWEGVQAQVKAHLAHDGSFFINIKPHTKDGQRVLYVMDLVLAMARRWGWCYIDEFVWTHQGYPGTFVGRFKNQFEPVFQFTLLDGEVTELTAEESFSVHHFGAVDGRGVKFDAEPVLEELSEWHHERLRKRRDGDRTHQAGYEAESGMGNLRYYKKLKGGRPGNVLKANIGAVRSYYQQAAVFPTGVPEFFIRAFTDPGDVVLDPFCGSGTTLAAAHRHGRVGLGIEMLPKYAAVILQRLADLGLAPRLVRNISQENIGG